MKIPVSRTGSFIPKWRGNRDLPENEQVICEYDYLDWETRRKYIKTEPFKLTIDNVDSKNDEELDREIMAQHSKFEKTFDTDDDGITAAMKPRFKNLEDNDGNAIDTWKKLLETPSSPDNQLDKLIAEVMQHCSGQTKEQDSKNS
jgi:hypothetical protein